MHAVTLQEGQTYFAGKLQDLTPLYLYSNSLDEGSLIFCSGKSVTFDSGAKYFVPIFLPEISPALQLQCLFRYHSRSTVCEN